MEITKKAARKSSPYKGIVRGTTMNGSIVTTPAHSRPKSPTGPSHHKKRLKQERTKQGGEQGRKSGGHVIVIVGCLFVFVYVVVVVFFCFSWIFNASNFVRFWKQMALAVPAGGAKSGHYVVLPPNPLGEGNPRGDVIQLSLTQEADWKANPDLAAYERRIRGELRNAQFGKEALLTPDGRVLLDTLPRMPQSMSFQAGRVLGIDYYHCSVHFNPTLSDQDDLPSQDIIVPVASHSRDLVFFNAQRFFGQEVRENESGGNMKLSDSQIGEHAWARYCSSLSKFGDDSPIDSIIALDLDVTASPSLVRNVLQGLLRQHRLAALPVAALVTPETSTKTVVDWIVYGDQSAQFMKSLARHWIPVSAGASILQAIADDQDPVIELDNVSSEQVSMPLPKSSVFRTIDGWPILAAYGQGDAIGAQGAQVLSQEISSASVLKLPGGRLGYLHFAEVFLAEVVAYLQPDALE